MKNYINLVTKEIFAYESDGSQDSFIQLGLVPITDADLATLRAPTPAQIAQAESDASKRTLATLDSQSLSLMRAYIVAKGDAPAALIAIQAAVVEVMKKVK